MTNQQTRIGRYAKRTDPDLVHRLRIAGEPTSAEAVAQHIARTDPEMFRHLARMVAEYRYRATCTCGWDSRWYLDPNVADEAAENHSTPLRHYATVEHKEV